MCLGERTKLKRSRKQKIEIIIYPEAACVFLEFYRISHFYGFSASCTTLYSKDSQNLIITNITEVSQSESVVMSPLTMVTHKTATA